jgi:acetyl esterase/lipase
MSKKKPDILKAHYAIEDSPPAAEVSSITRKFLNLHYAYQSEAQMLDIYLPEEGEGPFPVIVAIHGGAFMGCDKADMQVLPMLQGLKRGYAVVSINYRLSGEARFPALVKDAKAAVRWLRANAKNFSLDTARMAAWGGSAGGYQASMLGVSAGIRELEDPGMGCPDQPANVQAVVVWYGPTNFLKMDEQLAENGLLAPAGMRHNDSGSPEALLLGRKITCVKARAAAANPETYIHKNLPPFFLQHGTKDAVVPVQQSIEFAKKLSRANGQSEVTLELLEGATHADPMFETAENVEKVLNFLDRTLKQASPKT